ncbi:unnamed protein product [marine sediment metagenome]|uniref:Uncharacterized protein n=1 Tax=marine sediment metagenome TaxID=412755 RepID=X1MDE5_9ZZZZ
MLGSYGLGGSLTEYQEKDGYSYGSNEDTPLLPPDAGGWKERDRKSSGGLGGIGC